MSDTVALTEQLILLPDGGVLAVESGSRIGGLAFIRFSADEGATWRTEYSNFDRAAFEAGQEAK